ncbi:glycosyltransferase family 4 protein [Candidatus Parcubacteria bacterium]|nr:MAG: glycosyltransferase family 4 protein [Candidatus Parcubacteria bacterium]
MNILISSSSFLFTDTEGVGEGIFVYEIVKRLHERGHKLVILAPKSKLLDDNIKNLTISLNIDLFPAISELREQTGWHYFAYKSLEIAKRIIKNKNIDIIHHLAPSFTGMYSLIPLLKKPFIYGPIPLEHRNIDFKKEFIKTYEPPTDTEKEIIDSLNVLSMDQYQKTLNTADKIIVQMPAVINYLPKSVRKKCTPIPLGVDTELFCPPPENFHSQDLILSIGHMTAIKGFDYLIRAMIFIIKKRPQAQLILIGDGPDKVYFERLVNKLNLSNNIKFLGSVSHNKINTYLQKCNVYCQSSLSETFGLARLEAMSCGKPVVYTSAGAGENGFASNGKFGGMVQPRDPETLASEILRFLESPSLAKKAGDINRKLVLQLYDWDQIVTKYEEIYRHLLHYKAN